MCRSVLLCDENDVASFQLAHELSELGHLATICRSLDTALARLRSGERVDTVLLSHTLPGGEGVAGVTAIRQESDSVMIVLVLTELNDTAVFGGY